MKEANGHARLSRLKQSRCKLHVINRHKGIHSIHTDKNSQNDGLYTHLLRKRRRRSKVISSHTNDVQSVADAVGRCTNIWAPPVWHTYVDPGVKVNGNQVLLSQLITDAVCLYVRSLASSAFSKTVQQGTGHASQGHGSFTRHLQSDAFYRHSYIGRNRTP